MRSLVLASLFASALLAPGVYAQVPATPPQVEVLRTTGAAIIAGHPEATRLGMQTLDAGGTAADALVTVSAALGVVEPGNSGLGGKLVIQYYDAKSKQVTCILGMSESPAAIVPDEAAANGSRGAKAACTPGLVAGLGEAHRRWGVRPWKENLLPVIALAKDGFELSAADAGLMADFPLKDADPDAAALYAPTGQHPKAGDRLHNADLAAMMTLLANGGPESFYHGEIAARLAAGVKAKGGWISEGDLAAYKVRVLEPATVVLNGNTYYSSPAPLTGGTTMLAALSIMSRFDFTGIRPRDAKYIDIQGRALQQVYNESIRGLADVKGAGELMKQRLLPAALDKLAVQAKAADVRNPFPRAATREADTTTSIAPWRAFDTHLTNDENPQGSTTHLIIVDAAGNIACVTQTLGLHFGSGCVPAGTGILLNSDVWNFGARAGPNGMAPRKWPTSTMAPTIVLDAARNPVIAIGSPAAARIPVVIAQVLFDVEFLDRDLGGAIQAPRFHVFRGAGPAGSNTSYTVALEPGSDFSLIDKLKAIGWNVKIEDKATYYFGTVHAVKFNADGTKTVVADRRRSGDADVATPTK